MSDGHVRLSRFTPADKLPTLPQAKFLCDRANGVLEIMYGGAAGGGKSEALLMAALQFVTVKGYSALLLRRTFKDLSLPGALMDRAAQWLKPTDAHWHGDTKIWRFPSGATLAFGYLANDADVYQYQSAEFQFIGFDELTQFSSFQYRYMFSRLRRLEHAGVPLRMRAASNPGGVGHQWVKQRLLMDGIPGKREFIPARITDNPHLDREAYIRSLEELDPVTRAQLLAGDWDAEHHGTKFRRSWFPIHPLGDVPRSDLTLVRYWDLAATEPQPGTDPDWTASVLLALHKPTLRFWLLDARRTRQSPSGVQQFIADTLADDRALYGHVSTYIEQEPGSSGKHVIDHYMTQFPQYEIRGNRPSGSKEVRANPVSARAERGMIRVVEAAWHEDFFDELELFPHSAHDDYVDALSGAYSILAEHAKGAGVVTYAPGHEEPVRVLGDLVLVGEQYIDKE